MNYIEKYLFDLQENLSLINIKEVEQVIEILKKARARHKTIFTMGNGGSGNTASHFVNGLCQGATVEGKTRFKSVSLIDNIANVLAYANDIGYEQIFVEQLKNLLSKGDIVIGFSGSGNSNNVLNAVDYAKKNKSISIGFTGFDGGKLKKIVDYSIHVDCNLMEMVEDIHLSLTHIISSYFRYE